MALAVLCALVLLPASASADTRFGEGDLGYYGPAGLAVSVKESGDVYVLDTRTGTTQRVDVFTSGGSFLRAFGWGVLNGAPELQTCTASCHEGATGSAPGQFNWPEEIAIDNDPASPSYGDVYVVDQRNYRVEKYAFNSTSHQYEFLLMFGGGVDQGGGTPANPGNVCTAQYLANGDTCGAGLPGTGPAHFYQGSYPLEWGREGNHSIAIGPGGAVYVGDYGRIQEFNYKGEFTGELALPDSPLEFATALAVNASGDVFERSAVYSGSGLVSQVRGVREYEPAPGRALLRTFDTEEASSEPTHIALDSSGDLFVSDYANGPFLVTHCNGFEFSNCPYETFRAFKPTGALYAVFSSPEVLLHSSAASPDQPGGLALASAVAELYVSSGQFGCPSIENCPDGFDPSHVAAVTVPQAGPPEVIEEKAEEVEPTTATLNAVVNPKGFDTHYHFEYVDQATYGADRSSGDGFQHATRVPANPADDVDLGLIIRDDPVEAPISNLKPGTVYHWRAVAESHCHETHPLEVCEAKPEQTFESLPPVSVRDFTTQTVGPELVTLKAQLNPNNSLQTTHYTIHIGKDTSYSQASTEATLPAGSHEFEPVQATFSGLQPNTEYHYQLVAENEYTSPGPPFETADATFATEETLAEEDAKAACPNTTLREENSSTALPDCRAYEQVSPTDKGGSGVQQDHLAPSGQRVAFESPTAFAGEVNAQLNPYLAHRTPSGWQTQPMTLQPPDPGWRPTYTPEFSSDLGHWLTHAVEGKTWLEALQEALHRAWYLGSADGSFLKATPTLTVTRGERNGIGGGDLARSASADLSTFAIPTLWRLLEGDPRPYGSPGLAENDRIYAVQGAGGPEPTLSLAAEVPLALPAEVNGRPTHCGIDTAVEHPVNLVSASGALLFYTNPLVVQANQLCAGKGGPNPYALFACNLKAGPSCVEGQPGYHPATEISAPRLGTQCTEGHPCYASSPANASFWGASADGRLVWFTTAQPLLDSDTDTGPDLYLARLEPSGEVKKLVQASAGEANLEHPTAGAGAAVKGVFALSPEQAKVAYFIATGVLTEHENALRQKAVAGAENIYAYDAETGETKFVADLCTDAEKSGSAHDPACPSDLTPGRSGNARNDFPLEDAGLGRTTPDGRYLVFQSYGRLSADDTDNTRSVFRYDFATGQLIRVSLGRRGNDANGNDNRFEAAMAGNASTGELYKPDLAAEDSSRMISADGHIVIFETAAPLVSADTNAGSTPGCGPVEVSGGQVRGSGCDVYEWEEEGHGSCREAGGCVSLISDGKDPQGISEGSARISSSGEDVVFLTARGLVPADTDGLPDVYDARAGGGFPPPPPPEPCKTGGSPEACHGEATHPGPPPNPATEGFVGPGNSPEKLHCGKGRHRVTKHGQERCVPNRKHHHHRRKHRRSNANRRAGK